MTLAPLREPDPRDPAAVAAALALPVRATRKVLSPTWSPVSMWHALAQHAPTREAARQYRRTRDTCKAATVVRQRRKR
jgi:hypothetical protein